MRPTQFSTQNDGKDVTTDLYVWIAKDLNGVEGTIVIPTAQGMQPLIFTDRDRADRFAGKATLAAIARETTASLVVFHRGETLREVGA